MRLWRICRPCFNDASLPDEVGERLRGPLAMLLHRWLKHRGASA